MIQRTERKQGGKHKVPRAQVRTVQIKRACPRCRVCSEVFVISIIECEWHIITRMTGPNCAAMCNLTHTRTHRNHITTSTVMYCSVLVLLLKELSERYCIGCFTSVILDPKRKRFKLSIY